MYLFSVESKASFFYTILIMILFLIPNYFAIKATIDKEEYINRLELIHWVNKVEKSIYSNELELPRSVRFKIGLYDQNYNKITSDLIHTPANFSFETLTKYPYMYYKKNIAQNKHNVAYIICETKVNYSMILIISILLFLLFLALIYAFIKVLIRNTTVPYKQMQRYMDDFFNDSMHELKTPLGVININLELLGGIMQPTRHIKRIQAATKQMQMTYEDVEYYIKNKKVKFTKEKINVSDYLKSRISFFNDVALTKSITFTTQIEEDLMIFMNTTELQRIIDNTLSNAIKYSNFQGDIEIKLFKEDEKFCKIIVKDYGQGIKNIQNVFDRFRREDSAQGGFGLGLNIVQNICNKYDIEIYIESKESKGSTFGYKIKLDKKKFLDKVEENE
jgi:signal transduction histidine kinase